VKLTFDFFDYGVLFFDYSGPKTNLILEYKWVDRYSWEVKIRLRDAPAYATLINFIYAFQELAKILIKTRKGFCSKVSP
jgi:hypothetical protein